MPEFAIGTATPSAIRMADATARSRPTERTTSRTRSARITRNGDAVRLDLPAADARRTRRCADEVTACQSDSFRTGNGGATPLSAQVAGKTGRHLGRHRAPGSSDYGPAVSTAVVLYRIDLSKSLEPLPLKGIAGAPVAEVPYGIWSGAMSPLR